MNKFTHIPEKCDDYPGYKKGSLNKDYKLKCGKFIWEKEEKLRKNVQCYDDSHTKTFCITEKRLDDLSEQIKELIGPGNGYCKDGRETVVHCLTSGGSLSDCQSEMDSFIECVDTTITEGYETMCQNDRLNK